MKLHIGCGPIYLKGYVNIDAFCDIMAVNAPLNLLEENTTTFDNYYKHTFGEGGKYTIADLSATLPPLPFESETVKEIVMFHILEHFPQYEVDEVVKELFRVLEVRGSLVVAVPDTISMAESLANSGTDEEKDWWIRCLYGTQKNRFSHHYCGYTKRTLKNLLLKHGFTRFEDMPNLNCYPSIHLRAFKENSV